MIIFFIDWSLVEEFLYFFDLLCDSLFLLSFSPFCFVFPFLFS